MNMNQLITLLLKEVTLEWRQKYALNGVLIYTTATIFVCYLAFNLRGAGISPITWNTLFWIIVLFSAINTIAKSFLQEDGKRNLYYYSLCSPQILILAKMIYGALLMVVVSVLALVIYSILLGNPVQDQAMFLVSLVLGAVGFSSALTMISGIASKAGSSSMLMAILSFPVIVPIIILVLKASKNAVDGLDRSTSIDEILILIALNVIIITLALLLFPFLWRN